MTKLETAYETFTPGSDGFCRFVASYANLNLTSEEAYAIAQHAETPDEFMHIWLNEDFWLDA